MVAPLVILAFFAVTLGFINLPFAMPGGHWLSHLLGQAAAEFNVVVAGSSLLIALLGIAAGWFIYANAFTTAQDTDPLQQKLPGFSVLNNKFYIDELYAMSVIKLTAALAAAWNWLDRTVLDGILHLVGNVTLFISRINFIIDDTVLNDGPDSVGKGTITTGDGVRHAQTGKAQDYLGFVVVGVVILGIIYLYGM